MQENPVYKWCAVIWSSFFEDSREIVGVGQLAKAFGVNCQSDAQTGWHTSTLHAVASGFSLRFARDTRVQPPARAEKWVSKRGTLRFIQAMTPVALELRTSCLRHATAGRSSLPVSKRRRDRTAPTSIKPETAHKAHC